MKVAKVENHYSEEEFKKLFFKFKNDAHVYIRLVFIRSLLNGNTIQDSAKVLGINRSTGTKWLKRFNEDGVEGLKPHYNERGRKCKLSEEDLKKIEEAILEEDISYTIKDVQKFISKEFKIDYSYKQVWEITRIKLDLNY
ncbi:MAG: hypothetical protein BZ138_07685 [Methanosphaera sp. rholeuAM270]|nr:MAG: hypothetical protein BZ138_07685 [Methanosphaera sp. rholeuAM270]